MNEFHVTTEDPRGPVPTALIAALSAELAALYPDDYGGDGSGAFRPEDALVDRAAFVVVWQGGEAIGCGALRPMDEADTGEVKRMFVRREWRRQGVSRRILAALEDLARGFDYTALRLETGTRNPEAMGLYESSGYARTACYGMYVDKPLSVCYRKALSKL